MEKLKGAHLVCTSDNKIENTKLNSKKKYSNLVRIFKEEVDYLKKKKQEDIIFEQKKKELLKMLPLIRKESSCELNNLIHSFSNKTDSSDDMCFYNKTPHRTEEDNFKENNNYMKTSYSTKKRVYTPCNYDKTDIYSDKEKEDKISLYTTPKRCKRRNITKKESSNVKSRGSNSKKKKNLCDELVNIRTPVKSKNEYLIEKETYESITKDKWLMNESNMNELPENIKDEYVSYLCSPLKRSERLIKSKINKMLNENIEQIKQEQMASNSDTHKNSCTNSDILNNDDNSSIHCDFIPEEEEKCWDEFYTQSIDKTRPFTGITTELAVDIITEMLRSKIKKIKIKNKEFFSPISENDTIMEIGHGNHPLAVQMFEKWGTVGRYVGIEFSGEASKEALKCEKLKNLYLMRKVEFIKILSMKYYKDNYLNGVVAESNISPVNTKTDFIELYTFKYIFAKSTLDYITCRMDDIGNSCDWEEDLQISPTVVEMFNSLADSLQNCKKAKNNSYIIFVEPSNSSKFRDHILTIFKVIYTATFKYGSSAKYLRLYKLLNHNKACGYMLEKRNEVYESFEEMRHEFLKLILKSSITKNIDEVDWFLPTQVPKRWLSRNPTDIEYLVKLDRSHF
ncbi:hypothetical protein PFBG_04689 [Plasmodium falciparum 7G8]|uniref:Uncharacterized protein n=1 Tax=Plasmodium falciparum (isolate 7G8) TaxID=57266 RepID=W7F2U3_PLAF8|nr:hypothetical protein PFBG_04689 [Plasmodium falciparum 7G8]